MPRLTLAKYNPDATRDSQGFIHLQMGTNRFANQAGMTGFGMPRHNITHYKVRMLKKKLKLNLFLIRASFAPFFFL